MEAESVEKISLSNLDWSNYRRIGLSLFANPNLFLVFPEASDLCFVLMKKYSLTLHLKFLIFWELVFWQKGMYSSIGNVDIGRGRRTFHW